MRVCSKKDKFVVKGFRHGQMEEDMKENGRMEKCMVKENLFGVKENLIKENILIMLGKVMGNIVGQMEEHTKEDGRMELCMGKV